MRDPIQRRTPTNNKNRKRKFVGVWLNGPEFARISEEAKLNQRSIAGELRFRLLEELKA